MKRKVGRAGIFIFLLLNFVAAHGGDNFGVSVYRTNGVFWAHRKTLLHLEAPTRGFDVNFTFFSEHSKKQWPAYYRYPRFGISASYLDLGLPEITGSAFGLLPFLELRLIQRKHQELNFRWATGLGYLTKTWDLETNNGNRAIGSHLNANMRAHLMYHLVFNKGLELSLKAGITHYSNGNFKMPNLGVNCVEMGFGIGYNRRTEAYPATRKKADTLGRSFALEIRVTGGTKETSLVHRKRIFPFSLSGRLFLIHTPISRFYGGTDFFFDQGRLYRDNPAAVEEKPNLSNSLDIGLHLGHELLIGRLHFITEGGLYAYSPGYIKGLFYQRLGFKYSFNPHWNASVVLKTHFSRADLFEWGIGYTIFR